EGQVWRVVTFLMVPFSNLICALFSWYLFYLLGESLELFWGTFRYNVYLLIGLVATVGVSFLQPNVPATNVFLLGSVFLSFAFLNPDFELYVFFILPVRIKWFALVTWLGYGFTLIFGEWVHRLLILASVGNFLLFFAADIVARVKAGQRRMAYQAKQFALQKE